MKHSQQASLSVLLLSAAGMLLAAGPSRALTYTVTSLADDGGPGQLRAGIIAANASSGSTIKFQNGLTGTISLSPTLQALPAITVNTTIQGPGASLIAIDGDGTYRPFQINGSSAMVNISGLTIQHGMDAGGTGGAGILVAAGSLSLTDCTLTGNIASGNGGAIANFGSIALRYCTLAPQHRLQRRRYLQLQLFRSRRHRAALQLRADGKQRHHQWRRRLQLHLLRNRRPNLVLQQHAVEKRGGQQRRRRL